MSSDNTIILRNVWKRYGLPIVLSARSGWSKIRGAQSSASERWALRDINLEVGRGRTVAIVGRNGAGKSTLLKVIAGILTPTRGSVEIRGSFFPMIEVNAGLHFELTGRENTRLLAAVMGMSKREIGTQMDAIEEFTELGEWFDKPLRMYSSGMLARVGFSVAVHIRRDVILVDETFAVGDLRFQNKSLARLKEMRDRGSTILLVSHNLETLQFVAQEGIVLERGEIKAVGTALEAVKAYERLAFAGDDDPKEHPVRYRMSSRDIRILNARVRDSGGEETTRLESGAPFGVELEMVLERSLDRPLFSLGIRNEAGVLCAWNVSSEDGLTVERIRGRLRLKVWYECIPLAAGWYETLFLVRDAESFETLERIAGLVSFTISGDARARAVVTTKCSWELMNVDTDE